jgi:hypothetical protein
VKKSTSLSTKKNIPSYPSQKWQSSRKQITNIGEDVRERSSYALLLEMYFSVVTAEISMKIP